MSGFFAGGRFWDIAAADRAVLDQGQAQLAAAGVGDPGHESRLIWAHVAGDSAAFAALVARRAARAPLSHLLGYRDFYVHRFIVTPDVLDPRPDTEAIVAAALADPFTRVLDLGTGSGCILLSLLAARAQATGLGVDLSDAALAVAAQNRSALGLDQRATLVRSDWFAAVTGSFDLIVSNPPYIAAAEMAGLQPEVRLHEPHLALTDGADGLSCYRIIAAGAGAHLAPAGRLIVEIGPTQASAVSALFRAAGFTDLRVIPDLDGRDRGIEGRWGAAAA
ncbi:MAG: peptide chain release factor N(5)-glutamine methyltransferase [Proteobacteria bacterium]|nr:peptide chain release factor N(5)-glutamine methyltransferase [Pseudomonadota bacterium]